MVHARTPAARRVVPALAAFLLAAAGLGIGGPAAASTQQASGGRAPATADHGSPGGREGNGLREPRPGEPGRYLLSLGDSLGFGYQGQRISTELASGSYSPEHFPGYVVPLARSITRVAERRVRVVNYACPGETTSSMIDGPCAFADAVHAAGYPRALHDDYSGSQLSAAVGFLRAHRGAVSPITVSIGANDLNNLFNACARDVGCVQQGLPATLATLAGNLGTVLTALRQQAPHAEIIVLTPYNPAYVIDPGTDALLAAGDATIATVAVAARARVADGFAAINLALPGQEQASVCTFTLMCSQGDIHPSDAGYLRLAGALWTASGYRHPVRGRHTTFR